MEVVAERCEDLDLKALADGGEGVSWAGEVIYFREAGTEYRFELDDSMPGEAVFARITEGGRESGVQVANRPQGPAFRELPRGVPPLCRAVQWLRESRWVQRIAVYDGESGFYRLPR